MTWKTVVNKTENLRTQNTARDTNFLQKEAGLHTILGHSGMLCYFRVVLQFDCNNATQYCTVIQS